MHANRAGAIRNDRRVSVRQAPIDKEQLQWELEAIQGAHDVDDSYTALPCESRFENSTPEVRGSSKPEGRPEGEETLMKSFGIPQDAYGCAIIAIVREFQEALYGNDAAFHLLVGLFCMAQYLLNIVLQFAIVHFISAFVVAPRIEDVQSLYKDFHGNTFDEQHNFLEDKFNGEKAVNLCQIAMTNRFFYCTILFLWCLAMLKEARATERLFRDISVVPRCPSITEMVKTEKNGSRHIVALTFPIRTLLYVLVCIPKLCICIALLFLGCQWLSATDQFESLVMNTVAMEFVTGIDELLYEVITPIAFKNELEGIVFTVPCNKDAGSPEEQRLADLRKGFTRSVVYVASVFFWVFFYTEYVQSVFPEHPSDVAPHCTFAWDTSNRPCPHFNGRLLSFFTSDSSGEECFPYGIPFDPRE